MFLSVAPARHSDTNMSMSIGSKRFVMALSALAGLTLAPPAQADGGRTPVAIELVLAVDVSLSVDDGEFELQMRGISQALRQPEVVQLITQYKGGVAVRLLQWSSAPDENDGLPWRLLTDRATILAFADEIDRTPRAPLPYYTGIGSAIDLSVDLIDNNAFDGRLRKIDVSGDGRSNTGPDPAASRARALARDITINGLAVIDNVPALDVYYKAFVAGGPASFVIKAKNYKDFGRAMRLKLIRELTPLTARAPAVPKRRAGRNGN